MATPDLRKEKVHLTTENITSYYKTAFVSVKCEFCHNHFDSPSLYNVHAPCYFTMHSIKPPQGAELLSKEAYKCY